MVSLALPSPLPLPLLLLLVPALVLVLVDTVAAAVAVITSTMRGTVLMLLFEDSRRLDEGRFECDLDLDLDTSIVVGITSKVLLLRRPLIVGLLIVFCG